MIKLLGVAKFTGQSVEVRVHPALIPETHPFANVQNEYNAIEMQGDAAGDVMLYGKGAGWKWLAQASRMCRFWMSPILARQVAAGTAGKLPYVSGDYRRHLKAIPKDEMISRFYLRFTVG